jgi:hypothetical protein
MGTDDHPDLLEEYLRLLHLLEEVRSRFPSDNSPEVLVVTKQLERLETQIRAMSPPTTD